MIRSGLTKRQLESEGSRLREAQRDGHNTTLSEHDATILLQKLHSNRKEEWLDERILFILGAWSCRMQQLPACLLGTVRVDEHPRLRQEIKVIVPAQTQHTQLQLYFIKCQLSDNTWIFIVKLQQNSCICTFLFKSHLLYNKTFQFHFTVLLFKLSFCVATVIILQCFDAIGLKTEFICGNVAISKVQSTTFEAAPQDLS